MNMLLVFIGGGLGSVGRYIIGNMVNRFEISLPVATFISNVIACLIFAFFLKLSSERFISSDQARFFILTGVCGGLSTFSTFSYETFDLFRSGQSGWAIANILISVLLCILMFVILSPKQTGN